MRIAVLCPADIAVRRFLPALTKVGEVEFAGVAVHGAEERFGMSRRMLVSTERAVMEREMRRATKVVEKYGGRVWESYSSLIRSNEVDAIYLPLPPALHAEWAERALRAGKSVLVEKPAALSVGETRGLIALAEQLGLVVFENYAYAYHSQLDEIDRLLTASGLGDVRLYRLDFGFPRRPEGDFRYVASLGGGALNDAGGYVLSYASRLLGEGACVTAATLCGDGSCDVDLWGSGMLQDAAGRVAQISFGMDNQYRCDLEVWCSGGTLKSGRVFTAPDGFVPSATVIRGSETLTYELASDDSFEGSIRAFVACIGDGGRRIVEHGRMLRQAELVAQFREVAEKGLADA